jgi:hypothetical protein
MKPDVNPGRANTVPQCQHLIDSAYHSNPALPGG